jgi:hypothetical protein
VEARSEETFMTPRRPCKRRKIEEAEKEFGKEARKQE